MSLADMLFHVFITDVDWGVSLASNWARLLLKKDKLGIFKISFLFILAL